MSEKRKCDECGAELPANAPQGLCPRCLLGMAIYLEPATPSPRSSAITTNPAKEPQTKPPPAGARRFGDYELLGEIARGGMGIVYKARQISLKRNVAVKLLAFGKFSSDEFIRRFRTEAETVASLRHPNIVGIHDFGEQDGQYFFAMEYVEGENLAQKAAERPLPPRLAAKYLEAIARAVHYAHEHGVLHRDLKPGNVLIDQRDEPHVTDFGLAKRLRADLDLSLADQVVGTPNFAAPEQIRGKSGSLGPACDIYSLGALLYYLVTGRAPFAGETIEETLNLVLHTQPVAPRLLNPRAPRDLETICLKCMRADPSARYRSADELADDLNNWLAGKPILARPIRWPERASSWARRNPAVFGLTTATLLLLLALSIGSPFAVYRIRREALAAKQLLNETRLRRAENLFDADDTSAALAHLARVLRDDPTDTRAATRIYSALTQRSFPLPLFTPFAKNGFLTWAQWNYDSTRIATTDARGVVDLWDSEIGRHVLRFVAHAGAISSIRFSPDGARLITASEDGTARVWSSLDGQAVTLPLRHTKVVLFANFSPNSDQVVTCSADGTARLWDAQKGEPLAGPLTHSNAVNYAEFSPDGLSIVTAARDNTARLWSTKDGTPMGKPLAHKGWVISACFSPGGRQIVTASRDGTARVWDARSGKPLTGTLDLDGPGDWAEFSPDGQAVVTVSLIATARVWDARTGKPITPPLKHNGRVSSAHFSPDGQRIVTASLDRSARIWDARTGKALSERVRHEAGILSAQFETGGQRVLTASADSTAQLWDSRPASALEHRLRHEGGLNRAQFSPDGLRVLTASRDGTTRLWDAISGKPLISLRHAGRVQFASFNPDGSRLLTASQTGTAQIWDSATGQPCGAAFKHDASVECARFSPDGKRIVTASADGTARIWDANTCRPLTEPLRHSDWVGNARFSPDDSLVITASRDDTAKIWDAKTGMLVAGPLRHKNWVVSACFSPDGKWVLTASDDGTARVWDARTGQPVGEAMRHDAPVDHAEFSPDGLRVVTASADRTARIWDSQTGREVAEPLWHRDRVTGAQFNRDGSRVVTACRDGTARVWDARTGQPLSEPFAHQAIVTCARFNQEGSRVVTASLDQTARIWEVPIVPLPVPGWFARLAEAVAGQRLTREGSSESVQVEQLVNIRRQILQSPETNFYVQWGKWFFADRATRGISPFSPVTLPVKLEALINENTVESLRAAVALSPTNAMTFAALARKLLADEAMAPPDRMAEAEWLSRFASRLAPHDPEIAEVRARILAACKPSISGTQ